MTSAPGRASVLDDVRRLVDAVTTGEADAGAVARALGPVIAESTESLSVQSPTPGPWSRALVVRADDGGVHHLRLVLSEPVPLGAVRAAFGPLDHVSPEHDRLPSAIAYVEQAGRPFDAAIIVDLDRGEQVTAITVRRDVKLD